MLRKEEIKIGKRDKVGLTIVLSFVLLVIVFVLTILITQKRAGDAPDEGGEIVFVPKGDGNLSYASGTISSDDKVSQETNPLFGRSIYFAGLSDSVLNRDTIVYLENLKDNQSDVFMQYEIIDKATGDTVLKTGLIPAGEVLPWVAADNLAPGSYDLIFRETPYWRNGEDLIQLTAGENEVHFDIIGGKTDQ